ncbi:response regulator, partial [bacterium]|nr:response regulator [bacterium]
LMTSVLGYAELLQSDLADRPQVGWMLSEIIKAGRRAGELGGRMLTFARSGRHQPRPMEFNGLVREALSSSEFESQPGIRICVDLDPETPEIPADKSQIRQALHNLLVNAQEALGREGTIRIATRPLVIQESTRSLPLSLALLEGLIPCEAEAPLEAGSYALLIVEDDGEGMTEEGCRRAFEPFYSTRFMGRGLGLSEVHGIVHRHNGVVAVQSVPGAGAAFAVALPSSQTELPAPSLIEAGGSHTGTETILVIEDTDSIRNVVTQMLERLGYTVLTAGNGEEGVKVVREYEGRIDLALLDIEMPVLGGRKTFPLLRTERPEMKVIVCSGFDFENGPKQLLEAGADAFIQKPFLINTLSEQVRKVLNS